MRQIKCQWHAKQLEFLKSNKPIRGFVGGRGAGKTFVGAHDLMRRAKPHRLYYVVSPSYVEQRDAAWRVFKLECLKMGFTTSSRITNSVPYSIRLNNEAEIRFRSGEDPESLRGPSISGCWIDEASLQSEEVYNIVLAALREGGERGWLSATFTPKGKQHWTYNIFGTPGEDKHLVQSHTRENVFNFDGFAGVLEQNYTSQFALQEVGGQFVDVGGKIFSRDWFQLVQHMDKRAKRVRYWDKAGTEDGGAYTAGVRLARDRNGGYIVEHVVRGQWSAGKREEIIKQTAETDKAAFGYVPIWIEQEPGSGGKESAENTVRNLAGYHVQVDRVSGDKVTRAQPFAAAAERGQVAVYSADWTGDFLDELVGFPEGKYKDQVDAVAGAFNKISETPPVGYINSAPTTVLDGLNTKNW